MLKAFIRNWEFLLALPVAIIIGIVGYRFVFSSRESFENDFSGKGLTKNQALSIADSLHDGMRYSWVSDDYESVVKIIQSLQKKENVEKVVTAFGKRQENYFGVPTGVKKDLWQFIREDVPREKKDRIQKHLETLNYIVKL